ncbi:lantibiotic dehydratase [Nonomuraea sp. NPDC050153]|uniref:lantibiotic dehydratase n=1 Tax=Nonomuraea sp. NPDC050153 TaxID=3364359 RepID=UPI0037AE1105
MTDKAGFIAADFALLRMGALPAARGQGTRSDHGDPAGYLRTVTADPLVREAIAVSSPSLAHTLDAVHEGRPVEPKKLRRAVVSATRYVLRMATRPTPFGLMAGVAAARFDDSAKARIGVHHQKGVRPDTAWLLALIRDHERDPEVLRRLRVVLNDLCFARGDRLALPYLPQDGEGAALEVSVRLTALVRVVMERARRPVLFGELADQLRAAFPQGTREQVEGVLAQFVERTVLLTELVPPDDAPDPIAHVASRLPHDEGLEAVSAALRSYTEPAPGEGLPAWNDLLGATKRATRRLRPEHHAPHVDLKLDVDVRLPREVAAEFGSMAGVLTRITPPDQGSDHLRRYFEEFVTRYGTARLVPVKELLDPEFGLGAPAGYRASERADADPEGNRYRDKVLGELAQGAVFDGVREVELDDHTLARLATADDGRLPEVLEIGAHLLADSAEALDRGDFRLVLANMPISRRGGAMSGRFTYLLGELRDQTARLWREAEGGGAVPAQVTFQPAWSRISNVARVPTLADRTLPIGRYADRGDPSVLTLDDLAVGAAGERLFLFCPRLDTEIVPATLHMLVVPRVALELVRFIYELGEDRHRACKGWDWAGAGGVLPFLPRVRRGRTILASAIWRPAAELNDRKAPDADWDRSFDAWRERWQVPDEVYLTNGDNRVGLDLDAPLHRRILRDELARRPSTLLVEPPGGSGFGTGWLGGHANELVVTLRSAAPEPAVRTSARAGTPVVRHHPGGEWLFAKLYASADRHTDLLRQRLPVLLDALPGGVDRWFFIRYFDPGAHLRLRFHGNPALLQRDVLPLVHDWAADLCRAGLARTIQLDTYEPEIDRYGGLEALEAAERVFTADSEAVLAQLRLQLDLRPELLAAANYADLARAFHGPGWEDRLLAAYPVDEHHRAFQAIRRSAVEVVGGAGLDPRLEEIWRARRPAVTAYGELIRSLERRSPLQALLHMHHNRLVGASKTAEGASYAIARGAVQALRDRARHGR